MWKTRAETPAYNMTCRCRHLHGSWGYVGRKPRVSRCLASKTRHRENRGFLPACPCDPQRQAGGWRPLPVFRVLLFAHYYSTFSDLKNACYPLNPLIYNLEPSNGVCSAKLSVCTLLLNKPTRTGCALNLFGIGSTWTSWR